MSFQIKSGAWSEARGNNFFKNLVSKGSAFQQTNRYRRENQYTFRINLKFHPFFRSRITERINNFMHQAKKSRKVK